MSSVNSVINPNTTALRSARTIALHYPLKNTQSTQKRQQRGLTLLEMLIALAVAAIVLTVVAPSVQNLLAKNRVTSEINELSAVIQFARYTAIDQNSRTLVCPASDFANCSTNWNQAKIVFIDNNNNNKRDTSEPLLLTTQIVSSVNSMTGPDTPLVFLDSGATTASVSIKVCPDENSNATARAININAQGRVRVSIDSDNDGVYEDTDGNDLSCS